MSGCRKENFACEMKTLPVKRVKICGWREVISSVHIVVGFTFHTGVTGNNWDTRGNKVHEISRGRVARSPLVLLTWVPKIGRVWHTCRAGRRTHCGLRSNPSPSREGFLGSACESSQSFCSLERRHRRLSKTSSGTRSCCTCTFWSSARRQSASAPLRTLSSWTCSAGT